MAVLGGHRIQSVVQILTSGGRPSLARIIRMGADLVSQLVKFMQSDAKSILGFWEVSWLKKGKKVDKVKHTVQCEFD